MIQGPARIVLVWLVVAGCEGPAAEAQRPGARAQEPEHPGRWGDPPTGDRVSLPEAQWRGQLTPQEFHVLRERGTERAFTGRWHDHEGEGTYRCAGCGAPLFASKDKFDSGTGWPSYSRPLEDRVSTEADVSLGMARTEVHCARCGGHLGHVFDDGPPPTGKRYCINSIALDFDPEG